MPKAGQGSSLEPSVPKVELYKVTQVIYSLNLKEICWVLRRLSTPVIKLISRRLVAAY